MKPALLSALLCVFLALTTDAPAAQRTNESFNNGANGWVGTTFGPAAWNIGGGQAQITFFNTEPPFPYKGTLSNAPTASSGSFTGNYDQAGINIIGFTFRAPQFLPSEIIELDWGGSTSVFRQGFSVTQTGVWYNFYASISDKSKHEWGAIKGNLSDFSAARQSVRFVSVRVTTSASTNQTVYEIGSIYLDNEPEIGGLAAINSVESQIRGEYLLTNILYNVESAPDVTGTWSQAQTFLPTNHIQWINVTNSSSRQFWRFVRP
jgi:hypothetical protein